MKTRLFDLIDNKRDELIEMADYIFDNPEMPFEEYKASKLLTDYLKEEGFKVELGLGSLDTAFKATYENGDSGPNIGLLCEYDALPMGHGCAHHMQGASIVGAASAIKELYKDKSFTLTVYGTPAEEGGGGKIIMLKEGYLKELDVSLMMHGGPATQVDVRSLAASSLRVIYHGKSSHAALKPEEGRSALDALLLTFQAVEFLREHVLEDTRMHYTVLVAGGPNNVVPEMASGSFSLRSYNSAYLATIVERFEDIVKGAALMTGTTYEIIRDRELDSKVPVHKLNEVIMENANLVEAPMIRPAREKTGSSDFGNVMYQIPGSCIRTHFVSENASSHSQEFLDAGKTEVGHNAVIYASKVLAATAYDLINNSNLLDEIKEEFKNTKEKMTAI